MGKKRKAGQFVPRAEDNDKPDYAMDVIDRPAKPKKEKPKEADITFGEFIGQSAVDQLAKLKAQMEREVASQAPEDRSPKKTVVGKSAQEKLLESLEEGRELSFAELFDPAEEDDKSFDELLTESKQDWREYK